MHFCLPCHMTSDQTVYNALFLQGKTNTFPDRQQLFMENDHIICLTNDRVTWAEAK